MKKKFFITTFLLIILIANVSLANYSTVMMNVVEEPVCTIKLGENSNFEKKLISKDLSNKEVTIQLKVTNGEQPLLPTGEVVLLLDNSLSMDNPSATDSTVLRKDLVFNSAKTLLNNILKDNTSLKVAISRFSTNTDTSKQGTLEDASIVTPLTNDLDTLLAGIDSINADGPLTNLDAGLKVASTQFSTETNNKYLIVLTDGIPNVAVDYDNQVFSDDVIAKTNTQLKALGTQGINVITMLTGIANENISPIEGRPTNKEIITSVFGTTENPTAGKFYYVTDAEIENTITNDIYNALVPIKRAYTNIKITDYFPKEIIDNFDFAYVDKANIGEVSATVDKTNNSITWTIPELANDQTAIVQYKLKLKENFSSSIVDKLLDTNEKVDITFNDFDSKEQTKTSNVTPVLKLAKPPVVLPKTGRTVMIALLVVAAALVIFSLTKLTILNRKMK